MSDLQLARPYWQEKRAERDRRYGPPVPLAVVRSFLVARLSVAKEANVGNEETQLGHCETDCERYGFTPEYRWVVRGNPIYDQLEPWDGLLEAVRLIEAGQIDAVVAARSDRFLRDMKDAVWFYGKCIDHGIRRILLMGRLYDPMHPSDYKALLDLANDGQHESALKRVRSMDKGNQSAEAGKWHGGGRRLYGFTMSGETIREEADEIAAMMSAALGGKPFLRIARDLNARGVTTALGNKWTHSTVKQVLTNWTIAGWRTHLDAPVKKGEWEALVTRDQVEAVRAIISTRSRPAGRSKQLLTGLLRCGCGCETYHEGAGIRRYRDKQLIRLKGYRAPSWDDSGTRHSGHNAIAADQVELEVVAQFLHACDTGMWRKLAQADDSARRTVLDDELVGLQARLAGKAQENALGHLDDQGYQAAAKAISERTQAIQRELAQLQLPEMAGSELEHIRERWEGLSQEEQRRALDALVEYVELAPGVMGSKHWDPERVHVVWKV